MIRTLPRLWLLTLCALPSGTRADLRVDFGRPGGPLEGGFAAYSAVHERADTFTPQSYPAWGTTVTVTPRWADGAAPAAMQMIERGPGPYQGTHEALLQDWLGTDARQTGDPLTLILSGLPAGAYTWRSYHHDTDDQTGLFRVTVHDATGDITTPTLDISHANPRNGDPVVAQDFEAVTRWETVLLANGRDDITLTFDHRSETTPVSLAFFVINGFELLSLNPCLNQAPHIEGPELRPARVGEPTVLTATVTDDGLPYQEGCPAAAGTPWPLTYLWEQRDGPVILDLDSAARSAPQLPVTFPVVGTYRFQLTVTDGPLGDQPEDGRASVYNTTVLVRDGSDPVTVFISEFLAANRGGLTDGHGNSPDWIEIANAGPLPVVLDDWALTDDATDPLKWRFPKGTVLEAESFLVVFASKTETPADPDPLGYLHTNFKLSAQGEYLALLRPDGTVAQAYAPAYPPQEDNVSYGLQFGLPHYFGTPSPGAANRDPFPGFVAPVQVSRERGFYDAPFELQLHCDDPEAVIRYTLDGSPPDDRNGTPYVPGTSLSITTTTVLRAQARRPAPTAWRPRPATAHTYLFLDDVAHQPADPPGWPSDWGYSGDAGAVVPADYEMDPRVVDHTLPGYSVREALLAIPTVSVALTQSDFISAGSGIYANPLSRWERPCSVEYLVPPGHPDRAWGPGFQVPCKIEVHGNASRRPARMQKHSLRLTFSGEVGPTTLTYPLFHDTEVDTFNQLVLRACFTDSWGLVSWGGSRYRPNDSQYLRDIWMKDSLRDMGQPSSHGNFVHLYVNGLYFGLFNLTERLKGDFFASHLGGAPEDWEVNVDFSGGGARWRAMMRLDPGTPEGYATMQGFLDMENVADYMLLHIFADAEDWPHHNGYAAANPVSGDGRFRFWVWDQEIVLDYHGRAAQRIDRNSGVGTLFQTLRRSDDFRLLFADRVYRHCFNGGALSLAATRTRYRTLADRIDQAIVAESARWGDTQTSTPYGNTVDQPVPPDNVDHLAYPPAPHAPDPYFTREDSWVVERDNILENYLPAIYDTNNSFALIRLLRAKGLYPAIDPPRLLIDGRPQHGGTIGAGARLSLANPNGDGTVYYTLDGSDPHRGFQAGDVDTHTLVAEDARKWVWVPTRPISPAWRTAPQPGWREGAGSVGYERSGGYEAWIGIDVEAAMYAQRTSCYVSIPFACDNPEAYDALTLGLRYDDGFVAYLNGVEVARAGFDGTPQWNSAAGTSHESSGLETFDLSTRRDLLQAGDNLLALQGLNSSAASSDFLLGAVLTGVTCSGDHSPVSPAAQPYTHPLALAPGTTVKARCLRGQTWSALAEATYGSQESVASWPP